MKRNENSFVILIPGFAESETDTTCLPMQQAFVRSLEEQHPGTPYHRSCISISLRNKKIQVVGDRGHEFFRQEQRWI